jgi:hypothetical protein
MLSVMISLTNLIISFSNDVLGKIISNTNLLREQTLNYTYVIVLGF